MAEIVLSVKTGERRELYYFRYRESTRRRLIIETAFEESRDVDFVL